MLYLGGGGPQRYSPGEGGLATGIDASGIPIELVFGAAEKFRVPLIAALLENGASSNGLGKASKYPLELAMENEEYNMVVTLLQYHADSACIMSKAGDSLLHEALRQAFATGRSRDCSVKRISAYSLSFLILYFVRSPCFPGFFSSRFCPVQYNEFNGQFGRLALYSVSLNSFLT